MVKRKYQEDNRHTRLTTPLSLIPAKPHSETEVRFPTHTAEEMSTSPLSVMWHPQQLRELQERAERVRKNQREL